MPNLYVSGRSAPGSLILDFCRIPIAFSHASAPARVYRVARREKRKRTKYGIRYPSRWIPIFPPRRKIHSDRRLSVRFRTSERDNRAAKRKNISSQTSTFIYFSFYPWSLTHVKTPWRDPFRTLLSTRRPYRTIISEHGGRILEFERRESISSHAVSPRTPRILAPVSAALARLHPVPRARKSRASPASYVPASRISRFLLASVTSVYAFGARRFLVSVTAVPAHVRTYVSNAREYAHATTIRVWHASWAARLLARRGWREGKKNIPHYSAVYACTHTEGGCTAARMLLDVKITRDRVTRERKREIGSLSFSICLTPRAWVCTHPDSKMLAVASKLDHDFKAGSYGPMFVLSLGCVSSRLANHNIRETLARDPIGRQCFLNVFFKYLEKKRYVMKNKYLKSIACWLKIVYLVITMSQWNPVRNM